MARVLIPLPDRDFDVTEVAIPWWVLRERGHDVIFATEGGDTPVADSLLLTGVIFGQLGADDDAIAKYHELERTSAFRRPVRWDAIDPRSFDGLVLPGGHAPGMRQYLESDRLQAKVQDLWTAGIPVAAICHGVLVLARTLDPKTGKSVLAGQRTTCLPKYMERTAYFLTFWLRGRYYRTYPAYVEDEVKHALASEGDFVRGPRTLTKRGTESDDEAAFVVDEGRYVSARWPGDAWLFARTFANKLPR